MVIEQPNRQFSDTQVTLLLDKYQAFLKENRLVFVNSLYIMCYISLLLIKFVSTTHHRYDQFHSLSDQYKAKAQVMLSSCNNDQNLHLLLMEQSPL